MRLPPARRRALSIIASLYERYDDGIGASDFARLMWPDSKGHTTRSHRHATPAGGAVGAGIKMSAGAFLGRMANDGLLTRTWHGYRVFYNLSAEGRRALDEAGGPVE